MNMPLTTGQIAHADTVRELSVNEKHILDAIAADVEAMKSPTIDAAACDAAGVNEAATEYARRFIAGAKGWKPSDIGEGDIDIFLLGRRDGRKEGLRLNVARNCPAPDTRDISEKEREYLLMQNRFAGNRIHSYNLGNPFNATTKLLKDPTSGTAFMDRAVAGNRLDTLGHTTPLVKGGQGRNGLEVAESAKWLFVALACLFVAYVLYRWANGGVA